MIHRRLTLRLLFISCLATLLHIGAAGIGKSRNVVTYGTAKNCNSCAKCYKTSNSKHKQLSDCGESDDCLACITCPTSQCEKIRMASIPGHSFTQSFYERLSIPSSASNGTLLKKTLFRTPENDAEITFGCSYGQVTIGERIRCRNGGVCAYLYINIKPSSTVKWAGNCDYLDSEDNGEIVDLSPNKVCMINDEVRSFADDDDDPNPPSGVGNDIDNGGLFSNDGRSILIVGETAIAGVNLFNEGRGCIIAGDFTFYSDMVLKNKIPTNKW